MTTRLGSCGDRSWLVYVSSLLDSLSPHLVSLALLSLCDVPGLGHTVALWAGLPKERKGRG